MSKEFLAVSFIKKITLSYSLNKQFLGNFRVGLDVLTKKTQ